MPFIAALACKDEGHPIALRLGNVAGFRKSEAERYAKRHFNPDAIVLSDGLACFRGFASAGFEHQPVVTGGGHRSMELPEFQWLNTVLGNVKNAMQGTYRKKLFGNPRKCLSPGLLASSSRGESGYSGEHSAFSNPANVT